MALYAAILNVEQRTELIKQTNHAHFNAYQAFQASTDKAAPQREARATFLGAVAGAVFNAAPIPDDTTLSRVAACLKACEGLTSAELARGKVTTMERYSQLAHARDELLRIAGWADAALGYLMCKSQGADKAEARLRLGITQAAMAKHGAGLAPKPVPKTIGELRDEGYAVVVFDPDELKGCDPRRLESALAEDGFDRIGALAGEAAPVNP